MSTRVLRAAAFLFFTFGLTHLLSETLADALRTSKVPAQQFQASDLNEKITSYAISKDNPFLLAYYLDNGSGVLQAPLRLIRYDRSTGDLRRAELREVTALFQGELPMNCLGVVIDIREYSGIIYVDTHYNPSAGCVIVLTAALQFKAALSGWLIGSPGAEYAIVRRSEIHFLSVHPLHLAVFDVRQNQAAKIYPYSGDHQRRQFSRLINPLISKQWCIDRIARCDPETFDEDLRGKPIVNEAAKLLAFQVQFSPSGFGPAVEKHVPARTVTYFFRQRNLHWEHREFNARQLQLLLGNMSLEDFVSHKPEMAFPPGP